MARYKLYKGVAEVYEDADPQHTLFATPVSAWADSAELFKARVIAGQEKIGYTVVRVAVHGTALERQINRDDWERVKADPEQRLKMHGFIRI